MESIWGRGGRLTLAERGGEAAREGANTHRCSRFVEDRGGELKHGGHLIVIKLMEISWAGQGGGRRKSGLFYVSKGREVFEFTDLGKMIGLKERCGTVHKASHNLCCI